jgi:hypothetical protein
MADTRSQSSTGVFDVYDGASSALIGAIPISPQDLTLLHNGSVVTVNYHTPRMLRAAFDLRNGAFTVIEIDGKLFVSDAEAVKLYIELLANIAKARKDPSKWISDAEGNPPIR